MIHFLVVAVPACLLSADSCSNSDYVFDLCGLTLFSTQSNSRRALKKTHWPCCFCHLLNTSPSCPEYVLALVSAPACLGGPRFTIVMIQQANVSM